LKIPCEDCHTASGWRPIRAVPEFDHNKTKYPLRGMHEKVQCAQCHVKPVFADAGKQCQDCHADIHQRKMGTDCARCHTVLGWNVAIQQVKDHQNRFPLLGAHAAVQCEDCHKSAAVGQFQGLSTACASCHLKDFQNAKNPDHISAKFATTCESCHSFDSWLGARFDHNATGFPLTNGHANVPCLSCHINANYNLQIALTDCGNSQCHLTTWQKTSNPVHSAAGPAFAVANCASCHTTKGWDSASFDHTSTGFLLTNGHANVPCASCHANNNYNLTIAPTDCGNSGCHLTRWQQTTAPVHSTSGSAFAATNCANCHTTKGWDSASFDHGVTGFTLTGTHASPSPTPCASCHVSNNYTLNSTDCMGCHLAAWNSTPSFGGSVPNHITAGFPSTASACATCHPITKWADGKFDHTAFGFPLTNSHALVANGGKVPGCTSCHINNNYSLTIAPTDCGNSGCHLTTWQQTNNPVHPNAGAPFAAANCSTCHNTITWNTAIFDHSATGWALTGSHQLQPAGKVVACTDCHMGNNYTFTAANTDCMGCHLSAWNSTPSFGGSVPNHITAGFPTTASACSTCHPITQWTDGKFDHTAFGFPLTNSHALVANGGKVPGCTSCHINNNYSLTIAPTDCGNSQCHLTTWQTTNNPAHPTAGAPFAAANCSTCHNTITWTTAIFDHSTTGWPLTGSHQLQPAGKVVACTDCHKGNNYTFTAANTDCYGCHQPAWVSTQTIGGAVPNHITAGFPTSQCSTCHDTLLWADGKFDHSTTGWPLQGAHVTTPCSSCHMGASPFSLTSANTDCYGCHQAAWLSTQTLGGQVPNHIAAQFSTTCVTCHTTWVTTGWLGATLSPAQHTWFRIPHHGSVCSDCHVNSTNYATFSCINCHTQPTAHQPGMQHPKVNGYVYGPTICINCHKG
jgi:nitrate/TMAO reductase-like tetraheme cytochrome c subunit